MQISSHSSPYTNSLGKASDGSAPGTTRDSGGQSRGIPDVFPPQAARVSLPSGASDGGQSSSIDHIQPFPFPPPPPPTDKASLSSEALSGEDDGIGEGTAMMLNQFQEDGFPTVWERLMSEENRSPGSSSGGGGGGGGGVGSDLNGYWRDKDGTKPTPAPSSYDNVNPNAWNDPSGPNWSPPDNLGGGERFFDP